MGSNSFLSKFIADIAPSWYSANTWLRAPDQQTAQTSAFTEIHTWSVTVFSLFGAVLTAKMSFSLFFMQFANQ